VPFYKYGSGAHYQAPQRPAVWYGPLEERSLAL
jgi:hypothetical protein